MIDLSTDTNHQGRLKDSVGPTLVTSSLTSSLGTTVIPSNPHTYHHSLDTRLNCITDNQLTSILSNNPLAHTHSTPHNKALPRNRCLMDLSHHWVFRQPPIRMVRSSRHLSSTQVMEVRK